MIQSQETSDTRPVTRRIRPLHWLRASAAILAQFLLVAWGTLAIYYSNLPSPAGRVVLAVAFALFAAWALGPARRLKKRLAFAVVFLCIVGWFITIQPSHLRKFRPEVAVMPRAAIDGDRVVLTNVRNSTYRSRDDFTLVHEVREVQLSHLTSVDLFISYWKPGPVAHTFLSFEFDNARPVCISIETKPEIGEGFSPIASMFKQFELIYVVGDEKDLVGVRTRHRSEDVFLYHMNLSPAAARELFLVYLSRINQLADEPEFYHLLKNSCTINIVQYANKIGREGRWDIRHLLNGWVDRYLFDAGLIDTTLPFAELRAKSHINSVSNSAIGSEDFSARIRDGLPRVQIKLPTEPASPGGA